MPVYIFGERLDNGSGTFGDPFNATPTITSNNEYLFAAGVMLNSGAGVAINIPAGTTGVTIGAYDPATGARIPVGGRKAIIRSANQYTIRLNTNSHNAILENLDVSNLIPVNDAKGVLIGNNTSLVVNNTRIRACDIHNIKGTGNAEGINASGDDLRVESCRIWSIPSDGIFSRGRRTQIVYTNIWDVDLADSVGDCVQIVGDATLRCSDPFIAYCNFRNDRGNKQCVIIQDTTDGSTGGVIVANTMYQSAGASNQALYVQIGGVRVSRNIIRGGYYGAFVNCAAALFDHNVITDAAHNGLHQATAAAGLSARNNNIFRAGNIGINLGTTDTTCETRNNFIAQCGQAVARNAGSLASNNAAWSNASNGSLGDAALTADPLITPDGLPLPGSPLLTAGADLGYVRDIRGLQSRKHIGAYGKATTRRIA